MLLPLQTEVTGSESRMTAIDSKMKQIEALQAQFYLSSQDQGCTSVREEGDLLIRVRGTEKLLLSIQLNKSPNMML